MNLIQQLIVLLCNFLAYWNLCDSRDKKYKNGKVIKKSPLAVIQSFYVEFIRREKPAQPEMATRDYRVASVKFAPEIDYTGYETPSYTRLNKAASN